MKLFEELMKVFDEMRARWHVWSRTKLFKWGIKRGYTRIYSELGCSTHNANGPVALMDKMRGYYYCNIPSSIYLLSRRMTAGYCYECALLMAKMFLDSPKEVALKFGSTSYYKLRPSRRELAEDPLSADHCWVELANQDGQIWVIDTTFGMAMPRWFYYLLERPKVRLTLGRGAIQQAVEENEKVGISSAEFQEEYILLSLLNLAKIEESLVNGPHFVYERVGLLQDEMESFKQQIEFQSIKSSFEAQGKNLTEFLQNVKEAWKKDPAESPSKEAIEGFRLGKGLHYRLA